MSRTLVAAAAAAQDLFDSIGDPVLHLHEHQYRTESPEIRLFAALLEDVRFCLSPRSLVDRQTREAAVAWVRGEVDSLAPCSFREVCAILGLDEDATRTRLLALARGETEARRRRLDGLSRWRTAPRPSACAPEQLGSSAPRPVKRW